ncbi:MAG: ribosome silencing factor, partial [Firmicutes bacterium]|nr:ribosome silencing factor [Bacillota bacterium]
MKKETEKKAIKNNMLDEVLKDRIVAALTDKNGLDITVLDVAHLTVVADYFVIVSGSSTTHVKTLADYLDEVLSKDGITPLRTEGKREGRWVAVD